MSPVALVALVHIFDVLNLIVAHHHEAAGSLYRAKVVGISQNRHLSGLGGAPLAGPRTINLNQYATFCRVILNLRSITHLNTTVDGGNIEVTPVDADTVT